jgi:alpha-amylase
MNKRWRFTAIILTMVMLASISCKPVQQPTATTTPTEIPATVVPTDTPPEDPDWWKTAVFYEIFVRSFNDSDGNGIGDFNGITAKLDYLNDGNPSTTTDLGITGIWLMPIFPSPSYHGYDVTDYLGVNPDYGTMDDFRTLLTEAHKRGIHIIIDFVINHTSANHPWFISARDKNSPYRDYYIWSETNPGYAGPWGQVVWIPSSTGYYYALFWDQMPDLNFRNPAVTQEIYNATRFWLEDVGVDGFRVDAARHLVEDGEIQMNTPETHDWFKGWRTYYKSLEPNAMSVGEVWDSTANVAKYLRGDELDLAFNFDMSDTWISALSGSDSAVLKFVIKYEFARNKDTLFATFLTNHDMNRVMSQLNGDLQKAKMAAILMLTYPGVPFIYYGEEIGMVGTKPDEDLRLPMQWSSDPKAGFSTGNPWRAPNKNFALVNVDVENGNPDSLLNLYKKLIHMRTDFPVLKTGDLQAVDSTNTRIVAYLRENQDQTFLVVANLSNQAVSNIGLSVAASQMRGNLTPQLMIGLGSTQGLTVDANGGFSGYNPVPEIPATSVLVFRLR